MTRAPLPSLVLAFVVGGMTTTLVHAATQTSTVTHMDSAAWRSAPSGTARVQALAHGEEAWLGKLVLAANGKVPVHRDATEEFIVVLEGDGRITIDGTEHALRAGSVVYMPANAEVSYVNGTKEFVGLQVFAGPEPAAKYDGWGPRPSE